MPAQRQRHFSNLRLISRLIPYFWIPDFSIRMRIILSACFTIAMIAINLSIPLILKKVIEQLSCFVASQEASHVIVLLILYGFLWTFSRLTSELREFVLYRVTERTVNLISLKLFEHLHSLSIRFHLNRKTGAITNAVERVHKAIPDIIWGIIMMVPTIFEIVLAMAILWSLYGFIYGLVLFGILVCSLLFNLIGTELISIAQRQRVEKNAQAESFFVDSLLNFETVKYFDNQEFEKKQCASIFKIREDAAARAYEQRGLIGIGQSLILGLGLFFLVWKSGTAVISGIMDAGDFVAINAYILQFVGPVQYFSYFMRKMSKGLDDMEGAFKLLDVKSEIVDARHAIDLEVDQAEVVFDSVSFGYDPRRPILRDVSFTVPAGKMVAIVGSTGAGKSTISRLIFRFYDVTGGKILINNHDIREVTQSSLRKIIGIVPQDTVLFNNTLYYNIAYGRPDATHEEVLEAIKLAHLDRFIALLPDGYNTMVGERGLKLSGGEKQRVAIARVILKQPKIYIFDEATSALDTATERQIQQNLQEVAAGSTTLVIAHRLSTVTHADQIIVLDHGRVAQRGTHQELLKDEQGIYAKLWQKQTIGGH